jgi:hypothetical protein
VHKRKIQPCNSTIYKTLIRKVPMVHKIFRVARLVSLP